TSVARLTVASVTPGVLRRNRSMRFTQLAHVIPSMGSVVVACGVGEAAGSVILLGSIPPGVRESGRSGDTGVMPPTVHVAAVEAPWGPVPLGAWDRGLVACESMTPLGPFGERLGGGR